jgi:predicted PurR-regulated permease PerM
MVLILVVVVLSGIGIIFSNSLDSFLSSMAGYKVKLTHLIVSLREFFANYGVDFLKKEDLEKLLDPTEVLNFAGGFLKSFSLILSKSFLIFLTVTFMLFETSSLRTKIYLLLKKDSDKENPFEIFSQKLNRYLMIKTITSFVTGALIALGLSIIGVDFAIMLGLIAFLLNYIPSIGSVIAAIPAIIFASIGLDMSSVLYVVVLYLVVNISIGNIIEPKYMGKGLGLSVLVVFLSLIFWGWVFGYMGMFLAVPLSMTIKIALESHPSTRAIGMLLSSIDDKKDSR